MRTENLEISYCKPFDSLLLVFHGCGFFFFQYSLPFGDEIESLARATPHLHAHVCARWTECLWVALPPQPPAFYLPGGLGFDKGFLNPLFCCHLPCMTGISCQFEAVPAPHGRHYSLRLGRCQCFK